MLRALRDNGKMQWQTIWEVFRKFDLEREITVKVLELTVSSRAVRDGRYRRGGADRLEDIAMGREC
jgi:hypothetical protein